MKKVLQINGESCRDSFAPLPSSSPEADGDMIVQSGITWEEVNQTLAERGIPLFFPVSRISSCRVVLNAI